MSKVIKLTASFVKFTNAFDQVKSQDEHNTYVSMLGEEYAQRLRTYQNKQVATIPPEPTDEGKPHSKKGGGRRSVPKTRS